MPSDALSIGVTAGLGASVLAGIVTGVCYVLGYGFLGNESSKSKRHCSVCDNYLHSAKISDFNIVKCLKCHERVCKPKCCSRKETEGWICKRCTTVANKWMEGIFKVVEPLSKYLKENMSIRQVTHEAVNTTMEKTEDKEVREFMERLVNTLLCDDINNASVNKIYNDSEYLPIAGDSPCSAHNALKYLIRRIIKEASSLPYLQGSEDSSFMPERNRSYEDLLSTAILNKIISSSQNNISPSPYASSVCSQRSSTTSTCRKRRDQNYFFGNETLDSRHSAADIDTTSVSSIEEWVHSDSSLGLTKYFDGVSLKIKQEVEDASSSDSDESEENDSTYFKSNEAFQEKPNWFLQKRQFNVRTSSPVPVPMLVPDPNNEAKVLIGDQEVDQTSDLSDIPSDYEEESELNLQNSIIGARTVIGGKNPIFNLEHRLSEDEMSADSGVKECKGLDDDSDITGGRITQTMETDKAAADTSLLSIESNFEQDLEYTEKYATLPKTILVTPKNTLRLKERNGFKSERPQSENESEDPNVEKDMEEEVATKFEGYYSKKEKEKWKNAIEMKNNPYSKENIEKRIKGQSSPPYVFNKKYYIRQASQPCGANKNEITEIDFWPRKLTLEDTNTSETFSIDDNTNEYTSAQPVTNENQLNSISTVQSTDASEAELYLSAEITSDSDISWINCYDVNESTVYRKIPAPKEFSDQSITSNGLVLDKELVESFLEHERKHSELNRDEKINQNLQNEAQKSIKVKLPLAAPRKSKTSVFEVSSALSFTPMDKNDNDESLNNNNNEMKRENENIKIFEHCFDANDLLEIAKLKEQRLVASRLKQLTKTELNNSTESLDGSQIFTQKTLIDSELSHHSSVKDLRKLFEEFDNKSQAEKPIYSLSGRSISKQLKSSLRMLDDIENA